MAQSDRTIVIGGGIVGVCAAYELAKRGQPVTLVEQETIGAGASFGNAGIIAIGHAPLPRPGLAIKVLKWMLHGDSPLYIPPRFDWELIKWFWNFHRSCTPARFEECMKALGDLGRLSWDCFEQIMNEEQLDVEYHRDGWMEVYNTEAGFKTGREEADVIRDNGFEAVDLGQQELLRREPALKDSVVGAVLYTESSFTDPMRFLTQLTAAAQQHGAVIRENCPVEDIVTRNNKFAGVRTSGGGGEVIEGTTAVLAAGIWSTALAQKMGVYIPMQAGKGYHRNVERPQPCVSIATVLAEEHVAVTPMANVLRLAGTVEFSGINNRLLPRRLEMMSVSARKYLHGTEQQKTVSEWCGLRPCTADGLPVVGWSPKVEGIFVATGHARMGLALAPATGRIVADCLLEGHAPIDINLMRADRFGKAKAIVPQRSLEPAAV